MSPWGRGAFTDNVISLILNILLCLDPSSEGFFLLIGKYMVGSIWSIYIYWGFNLGFEMYEELIEFEEGDQYPIEYLLINLGCIRIQRGRYT